MVGIGLCVSSFSNMTKDCFDHRGMTADKTKQTMTKGGRCGE